MGVSCLTMAGAVGLAAVYWPRYWKAFDDRVAGQGERHRQEEQLIRRRVLRLTESQAKERAISILSDGEDFIVSEAESSFSPPINCMPSSLIDFFIRYELVESSDGHFRLGRPHIKPWQHNPEIICISEDDDQVRDVVFRSNDPIIYTVYSKGDPKEGYPNIWYWIIAETITGPGDCLNCGYDLRGQVEPRCPECGTEFDPESILQELP